MNITAFVGVGKENATPREQLVATLNLSDRTVRRLIEEARCNGELILNDSDGAGYYISNDIRDLRKQYKTNENRVMSIWRQQIYLSRKIKELETAQIQMTIDEVGCKEE